MRTNRNQPVELGSCGLTAEFFVVGLRVIPQFQHVAGDQDTTLSPLPVLECLTGSGHRGGAGVVGVIHQCPFPDRDGTAAARDRKELQQPGGDLVTGHPELTSCGNRGESGNDQVGSWTVDGILVPLD